MIAGATAGSVVAFSPSTSGADRARASALVRDATRDLRPVVVVARRMDDALRNLDAPADALFTTVHTDGRAGVVPSLRRAARAQREQVKGIYGDGPDAGHTVYGSVRFVGKRDARRGAESVLDALARQGDVGVEAYGPVVLVPEMRRIAGRTTIAADDTGATDATAHPLADLADVVVERLERSDGEHGAPRLADLLQLPRAAARDALRGWLLSDALADSHGYIEAQVRGMRPAEIGAAAVKPARSDGGDEIVRRATIDPGPSPDADAVSLLERAAAKQGLDLETLR